MDGTSVASGVALFPSKGPPMERALGASEAVERLKGVFLEIPGTRLTVGGAARLAGVDRTLCHEIMVALEDARFLKRGRDGRYRYRARDSPSS